MLYTNIYNLFIGKYYRPYMAIVPLAAVILFSPALLLSGKALAESGELSGIVRDENRLQRDSYPLSVSDLMRRINEGNGVGLPNFNKVYSSDFPDYFGDYTVKDALYRLPGFQVNRNGEINLRGAGHQRENITIDGQRIGTSGLGHRSVDLSGMNLDMYRDIEVIKVLTPDMDAEALAGRINLKTHHQPGGNRELNILLGGGGNTRYFDYTGLGSRAALSYKEVLREDITLSVNLSYLADQLGRESLAVNYEVADFGAGPVDVVEQVSPGLQIDQRNLLSSGAQLSYEASEQATYYIRVLHNGNNRDLVHHRESKAVNGDWLRSDTTGAMGRQGIYSYDLQVNDVDIRQYFIQTGARYSLDRFDVEYNLGWSQSRATIENYTFPFHVPGLDYSINMEDRSRINMIPANVRLLDDGTVDRRLPRFDNMELINDDHLDNTYDMKLDITYPFSVGFVKLGSSARIINNQREFNGANYNYRGSRLRLFNFGPINARNQNIMVFNEGIYQIPWLVDSNDARLFIKSDRPMFEKDGAIHDFISEIRNYSATENLIAAYGMTSLDFGPLSIMGGFRMEYETNRYEGGRSHLDQSGNAGLLTTGSEKVNHMHLFPNAHLSFRPVTGTHLHLAYSKSISRPAFNQLSPFEGVNERDSIIYRGNPSLNPMFSDNIDVLLDHYYGNHGVFSIGMFHKKISNFISESSGFTLDDRYVDFQEFTYVNGNETATIYGVEFSLQQQLSFLPGAFSNLGIYSNYTWTRSRFDTDIRNEVVNLPGQSPHVVNLSLDYNSNRLGARVSYHWTAEMLAVGGLQSERRLAPSIDRENQIYMDRYEDGWSDLSASLRYRITGNFRIWADASNLLGGIDYVKYAYERHFYNVEVNRRGGRTLNLGVTYTL